MHARNAHGEHDTEREKRERTRRGALPEERGHRAQTRPNARPNRQLYRALAKTQEKCREKKRKTRFTAGLPDVQKKAILPTYLNDFNSSPTLKTNITITTKS